MEEEKEIAEKSIGAAIIFNHPVGYSRQIKIFIFAICEQK